VNVFDAGNTKSDWAFIYGEKIMTIMLSRFNLIPERDGQTDGRTDGITICYINIASVC